MKSRRFYAIISSLTILGYLWIAFHYLGHNDGQDVTLCIFKRVTSYPCPACGSTRSLLMVLNGQYYRALEMNPFGYILFLGISILPIWLFYDWYNNKHTLYRFYIYFNSFFNKNKVLLIPLIVIVLLNWIWNIIKGI